MRGGSRGFTLLEVVVAIVILATLSVLLVGVIPATVIGLKSAGERATAASLAANAVESLRRQPFADLAGAEYFETLNGRRFDIETSVGPAVGSDGAPLDDRVAKEVVVSVRWVSKQGPKEHVLRTFLARSPR